MGRVRVWRGRREEEDAEEEEEPETVILSNSLSVALIELDTKRIGTFSKLDQQE